MLKLLFFSTPFVDADVVQCHTLITEEGCEAVEDCDWHADRNKCQRAAVNKNYCKAYDSDDFTTTSRCCRRYRFQCDKVATAIIGGACAGENSIDCLPAHVSNVACPANGDLTFRQNLACCGKYRKRCTEVLDDLNTCSAKAEAQCTGDCQYVRETCIPKVVDVSAKCEREILTQGQKKRCCRKFQVHCEDASVVNPNCENSKRENLCDAKRSCRWNTTSSICVAAESTLALCNSSDAIVGETLYDTSAQCCGGFAYRCPAVKDALTTCLSADNNNNCLAASGCAWDGSNCYPESSLFAKCATSTDFDTKMKCCEDLRLRCDDVATALGNGPGGCDRNATTCEANATAYPCEVFGDKCGPMSPLKGFCLLNSTSDSIPQATRLLTRCCGKHELRCSEHCSSAAENNDTKSLRHCCKRERDLSSSNTTSCDAYHNITTSQCESAGTLTPHQTKFCCKERKVESRCEAVEKAREDKCKDESLYANVKADLKKHVDFRCCTGFPGENARCNKLAEHCNSTDLNFGQYKKCCRVLELANKTEDARAACGNADRVAQDCNAKAEADCTGKCVYNAEKNKCRPDNNRNIRIALILKDSFDDSADLDAEDTQALSDDEVGAIAQGLSLNANGEEIDIEIIDGLSVGTNRRRLTASSDVADEYTIVGSGLSLAQTKSLLEGQGKTAFQNLVAATVREATGRNIAAELGDSSQSETEIDSGESSSASRLGWSWLALGLVLVGCI